MGLQSWGHDNIRKADVSVSKNYLAEREMRELNRLTDILLSIFEDQADLGRLVTMQDARTLLDIQLRSLGRAVLLDGRSISAEKARARAEDEYAKWAAVRKAERHRLAEESIVKLLAEAKALPRSRK